MNNFIFSQEHLMIILIFLSLIYITSKFTKHLLPYSHWVERILQVSIISIVFIEQLVIIYSRNYSMETHLPISLIHICAFMGFHILCTKNYDLFDVYYSWSLVCSLASIIIFKDIGFRFPHILYSINILLCYIILFLNIFLMDVRKFEISKKCISKNFKYVLLYFSIICLTNIITKSNFTYTFLDNDILGIPAFLILTTIAYLPYVEKSNKLKIKVK